MGEAVTVISVEEVSKEFRSWRRRVQALAGVSFEVRQGEAFGLLGANGAGKTTLVKILLGLAHPTSGRVTVRGMEPVRARARRRVGYLPEGHRFPGYLSGEAAMRLFGRLAGLDEATIGRRTRELLALVGLSDRGGDRISRYSKGMTQRLGLACALLDEPEVLFLDEPTDGVDPVGRRHIRDVLLDAKAAGTTIFINSHLLSEVERTCDRVAILHQGRLLREAGVDDLTHPSQRFRIRLEERQHAPLELLARFGAVTLDGHIEVAVPDLPTLNHLLDELRSQRLLIAEVTPQRAALEDVFIELVREERGA
ncbi:MAG: ABC transporter ATP-binding protein [Thermoanaerobaculaceae bacterium]|nr:ABC transporter ATP-binding protein [Thermoanaerobaculaceae bacterium]MDI9623060.1 ABC transporter ATP-binding protein [Acidobacteriota bacterium]NLH10559.1 ABC transporter ATP-binding protein [Holophagae bacterium]HPW55375.1 ABC transporter ATP-binding protein [Thermoanaerobaculaceae bacterium]